MPLASGNLARCSGALQMHFKAGSPTCEEPAGGSALTPSRATHEISYVNSHCFITLTGAEARRREDTSLISGRGHHRECVAQVESLLA